MVNGKPGPAKRPLKLAALHGETRPSRVNKDEPVPAAMEPDKPDWFLADAAEVWDQTTHQLRAMGLLAAADQGVIMVYCQAVVKYTAAVKLIDESGIMLRGRDGGAVKNPAAQIMRDMGQQVLALSGVLGLSPSARTGLTGPKKREDEGQGAERLLS